jgi:hypothetical protein
MRTVQVARNKPKINYIQICNEGYTGINTDISLLIVVIGLYYVSELKKIIETQYYFQDLYLSLTVHISNICCKKFKRFMSPLIMFYIQRHTALVH